MRRLPQHLKLSSSTSIRHQVSTTFIIQLVGRGLTFLNTVLLAYWLGAAGKGTLDLALLVIEVLALFFSGGIAVANVYFTGSRRRDVAALSANAMVFTILGSLAGLVIVGALVATGGMEILVPGVPVWLVWLATPVLPLTLSRSAFAALLQGLQQFVTVNTIDVVQHVLTLFVTLVLVGIARLGLAEALIGVLLARTVALILLARYVCRAGGVLVPRWDRTVMAETLAFGMRGQIGNILQFFNYRLDAFLVNGLLGTAEVGIYSVAVRLTELLWQLPNAVGFVIFPRAAASRPEELNRLTPRLLGATLALTTLGALTLALIGHPLIRFLFSPEFLPAYVSMLVLLPGVVLLGGAKVLTNEIAGRGYPHYNSFNAGLALVLTVAFDLLLIPVLDIVGAALASSIAYSVIFLVALGCCPAVRRHSQRETLVHGRG